MSTTITHAGGVIHPVALRGWEAAAETRSVVVSILGRADPDILLRPPGLRTGRLDLVFATGADAYAARAVLAVPQSLILANSGVAQVAMRFVVAGGELGEVLGAAGEWTLTVPFQEVSPCPS